MMHDQREWLRADHKTFNFIKLCINRIKCTCFLTEKLCPSICIGLLKILFFSIEFSPYYITHQSNNPCTFKNEFCNKWWQWFLVSFRYIVKRSLITVRKPAFNFLIINSEIPNSIMLHNGRYITSISSVLFGPHFYLTFARLANKKSPCRINLKSHYYKPARLPPLLRN